MSIIGGYRQVGREGFLSQEVFRISLGRRSRYRLLLGMWGEWWQLCCGIGGNFRAEYAHIADFAWRGYSGYSLKWRLQYYEKLTRFRQPGNVFCIIEHYDDHEDTYEDCAFISIFPVKQEIYTLHFIGKFSQYYFDNTHLEIYSSINIKTYHYVQSLFLHEDHSNSMTAKKQLRQGILDLLKRQRCGYKGRPFVIYAETSFPKGKKICRNRGLIAAGKKSAEGKPFSICDSDKHHDQAAHIIKSLWG